MNNDAILTANAIQKLEQQKNKIDEEIRKLKQLAWSIKIGTIIEFTNATNKDFMGQYEVIQYDALDDHWVCIRKDNPIILFILDKNEYTIIKHLDEKDRLTKDQINELNRKIKNGR